MVTQEKMDETTVAIKLTLEELLSFFEGRDEVSLTPYLIMSIKEFVDYLNVFRSFLKGPRYPLSQGGYIVIYPIEAAMWGRRRIPVTDICKHLNEYIAAFSKTFNMQIEPLPDLSKPMGV